MKSAFFAVNKPRGVSSAQVVSKIKYLFKQSGEKVKVGNMGTLDVDASGVLVIALNKATRLFQYFGELPKTYQTIFKFGIETDTLDSTGEVVKESIVIPKQDQLKSVIKNLIGEQNQIPPLYSAKKVNGERAYNLARRGEYAELSPKLIKIYDIKLIKQIDNQCFEFEITCSSGTYIRAIARDTASLCSTYGITTSIIRTKSGIFNLNNALDFDNLNISNIKLNSIDVNKCLNFQSIEISVSENKKLLDGLTISKSISDGLYFTLVENKVTLFCECKNHELKIVLNLIGE